MESAKRRAPAARPVLHNGVRYEQLRRPSELRISGHRGRHFRLIVDGISA